MILEIQGLAFGYPCHNVLHDVTFTVKRGEALAILGTNGVGKSTLLKCIAQILPRKGGKVLLAGVDAEHLGRNALAQKLAYVAQSVATDRTTVFDAVLLGRRPYIRWEATPRDLKVVESALDLLGLSDFALRYLDQLSGGEVQKVLLARALAQEPDVLLLDEPTSNLDLKNQLEVIALIRKIARERDLTAIVTMHDLNLALRFADRFLFLREGGIFAAGGAEIITPENIKAVYGVDVLVPQMNGYPVVVPCPNQEGV